LFVISAHTDNSENSVQNGQPKGNIQRLSKSTAGRKKKKAFTFDKNEAGAATEG